MKPALLFPLLSGIWLGACTAGEVTTEKSGMPTEALVVAEPATPAEAAPIEQLALTAFSPSTNEIYCSFYTIGDDGLRADRVFITELAGVPAPAHVGLEGEGVSLTETLKRDDASPQVWVYENVGVGLIVELQLTETGEGFESRDYEGTLDVSRLASRTSTAVSGTCGV